MALVRVESRDAVALVILDDPARRNALSLAMADELRETCDALAARSDVGAVVVTGAGPAFSAGADLDDLERADRERLLRIYDGFLAVARFPLPTIAAVNGAAVGAGLNLALACDLRIAGRAAWFESRFIDLALHPGGGHTWLLSRLVGLQGTTAMVLLGEGLDGETAAERGLAWSCVPDGDLLDEALRMAGVAARAPRDLVRRLKATVRGMRELASHDAAVDRELEDQLWSIDRHEFRKRIGELKARIARKRKP